MDDSPNWLQYCKSCKRSHIVSLRPCHACQGRSGQEVAQPTSPRVRDLCYADYACTGCQEYRDHLR